MHRRPRASRGSSGLRRCRRGRAPGAVRLPVGMACAGWRGGGAAPGHPTGRKIFRLRPSLPRSRAGSGPTPPHPRTRPARARSASFRASPGRRATSRARSSSLAFSSPTASHGGSAASPTSTGAHAQARPLCSNACASPAPPTALSTPCVHPRPTCSRSQAEANVCAQKLCHEALAWRQLAHAHVLPFLGIDAATFASTGAGAGLLCLVAPYMRRGTLREFVRSTEYDAGRDMLRLVSTCSLLWDGAQRLMRPSNS
jgi:hypothetical protein